MAVKSWTRYAIKHNPNCTIVLMNCITSDNKQYPAAKRLPYLAGLKNPNHHKSAQPGYVLGTSIWPCPIPREYLFGPLMIDSGGCGTRLSVLFELYDRMTIFPFH